MTNGESKIYRGYTIRKENGRSYKVGGFMTVFKCYADAKDAIDASEAEDKALREAEEYVQNVLGGWL